MLTAFYEFLLTNVFFQQHLNTSLGRHDVSLQFLITTAATDEFNLRNEFKNKRAIKHA